MTSKADKLPLETDPVARDNNTVLTLKPGDQTLSRLTQLIIVVSVLLRFSKQRLVENIQGKFKKNSSVTLISEESP